MAISRFLPGGRDVAIDLGTANTLVFVAGEGIVVDEPSVVAVDESGEVYAVGSQAERMLGRTPATISAQRPLKDGVIADFEVTEQMLRHFIRQALGSRRRARLIVCAPSGITAVEARAVVDASLAAGARNVELIEEPIAAALGAGLDIAEAAGKMIVDIGGGTSEVALLSMGGIVVSKSLRLGGYALDEAVVAYVRREYQLAIGSRTAEQLKLSIGSASLVESQATAGVRGRDVVSGLPREVMLGSDDLRSALEPTVVAIIEGIQETLARTPPNLAADVAVRGIVLAGGGALLGGLGKRVHAETGMPVRLADSPLTCVVTGAGEALAVGVNKKRPGKGRRPVGSGASHMASARIRW